MINSINSDLIRGHIDTIILSVLSEGDRYGYDILGEIENKSGGQYSLKQPTLYSCLKRLETQGFVYKYWGTETNGGRRTYYSLTEMGKELFQKNKDDWEHSRTIIDQLISDKPYNGATTVTSEEINATLTDDTEKDLDENILEADAEDKNAEIVNVTDSTSTDEVNIDEINQAATNGAEESPAPFDKADTKSFDDYFLSTNESSYADRLIIDNTATSKRTETEIDTESAYFASEDDKSADFDDDETVEEDAPQQPVAASSVRMDTEAKPFSDSLGFTPSVDNPVVEKSENTISESARAQTEQIPPENRPKNDDELNFNKYVVANPVTTDNRSYDSLFKKYNTQPVTPAADKEIIIEREYRGIIKGLLSFGKNSTKKETPTESVAIDEAEQPIAEEIATTSADTTTISEEVLAQPATKASYRNEINFDEFKASVQSMGEQIQIRTHNTSTDRAYTSLYFYYINRLLLVKYSILFVIMLAEIIVPYIVIKFGFGISPMFGELPVLIISVITAALFPMYAILSNLLQPYKRKRYDLDIKMSVILRTIITVLLLVLIYAVNVICYMDISFEAEYAYSLITPALLCSNILISLLLFKLLYNTKKFAAND